MESIGKTEFYALHLLATWTKENPQKVDQALIEQAFWVAELFHSESSDRQKRKNVHSFDEVPF